MKKTILLVLASLFILSLAYAGPRLYTQSVRDMDGNDFPDVVNPSSQTAPGYQLKAWVVGRESEIIANPPFGINIPSVIRLFRFGNGTTHPYQTRCALQMGNWPTPWAEGETVHFEITNNNVDPAITDFWEIVIPEGVGAWTVDEVVLLDLWPSGPTDTFWLRILSMGLDEPGTLLKDGVVIGTTPYMPASSTDKSDFYGTYTMQDVAGGTWAPADLVIDENTVWPAIDGMADNYQIMQTFEWTADIPEPDPTYTVFFSTDPAGYITPNQLVPTDDL